VTRLTGACSKLAVAINTSALYIGDDVTTRKCCLRVVDRTPDSVVFGLDTMLRGVSEPRSTLRVTGPCCFTQRDQLLA
jgi:hypothetical protein